MDIGSIVKFTDEYAVQHDALVTTVFDNGNREKFPNPAINVVYVSKDASQTDQYGRQIVRKTSVVKKTNQSAHGYFWDEA